MKILDLISEAPLPADWDKSVYTRPQSSFKKMVDYAKARAARIGGGSSRVAFEVEYEGRPTILKIAKNAKGLAQNEQESTMFGDYYLKGLNISIPIIDFDEENDQPTWVQMEKAQRCTPSVFKKAFSGLTPQELVKCAYYMTGNNYRDPEAERWQQLTEENEHIDDFIQFVGNYDINMNDFSRLANWGIYQGNVVVIDMGFTDRIYSLYYRK